MKAWGTAGEVQLCPDMGSQDQFQLYTVITPWASPSLGGFGVWHESTKMPSPSGKSRRAVCGDHQLPQANQSAVQKWPLVSVRGPHLKHAGRHGAGNACRHHLRGHLAASLSSSRWGHLRQALPREEGRGKVGPRPTRIRTSLCVLSSHRRHTVTGLMFTCK